MSYKKQMQQYANEPEPKVVSDDRRLDLPAETQRRLFSDTPHNVDRDRSGWGRFAENGRVGLKGR